MSKKRSDIANILQQVVKTSASKGSQSGFLGTLSSGQVLNSIPGGSAGYGKASSGGLIPTLLAQAGKANSSSNSSSSATSELLGLVTRTANNGLASALGSGFGGLGGIGSVISGLINLFGGNDSPTVPALVPFQLPDTISQTVYASGSGFQTYQGNVVQPVTRTDASDSLSGSSGQVLRYSSGDIAQAVKQALINSSTLSDVIAEI